MTHIVCCIAVVIHPSKECRRRIFSNVLRKQVSPTGVLVQEVRHIVNKARNTNQWPAFSLRLICEGA